MGYFDNDNTTTTSKGQSTATTTKKEFKDLPADVGYLNAQNVTGNTFKLGGWKFRKSQVNEAQFVHLLLKASPAQLKKFVELNIQGRFDPAKSEEGKHYINVDLCSVDEDSGELHTHEIGYCLLRETGQGASVRQDLLTQLLSDPGSATAILHACEFTYNSGEPVERAYNMSFMDI